MYMFKFGIDNFCEIKLKNDVLFFKVWRNVYLRNKFIFYHLRKFNIAHNNNSHSFNSLREYPLRNYLTILKISMGVFFTNKIIPYGIIPNSVKEILINQNLIISKGDLPDSIISIKFGKRFKEYIETDAFPINLISLKLGPNTKIRKNIVLPKSLKYLSIERKSQLSLLKKVNSSIEFLSIEECDSNTIIPTTIKKLGFARGFNYDLPKIPKNIEFLYIGNKFKKEIDFFNLSHLKILKIGKSKIFTSLYEFSIFFKQLIDLKIYMAPNIKEYYTFSSLEILNINDQNIEILGYIDTKLISKK
ncbi:hypothetical protein ACTFIW_004704 [Dictyostelium discoideum]